MSRPRVLQGIALFTFALVAVAGVLTAFHPAQTSAAASSTVNFQARLEAANGAIVPDGNYNVEFKLYSTSTVTGTPDQGACTDNGGTADPGCLWVETRTAANQVRVVNGYLTVNLGSVTAFPSSINWNQQLWLTMRIGGTGTPSWDAEMSPRLQLTALPYAFQAGALGNGTNQVVLDSSGNLVLQQAGTIKELSATSGTQLIVQGGAATSGTNTGGNLMLQGGAGASTGASGSVIVKPAGNDSTAAFQVQNASSANLFTVDTANNALILGNDGTPNVLTVRGGAASGTNAAGADITFDASNGTGTAGSGSIIFRTAAPSVATITNSTNSSNSSGFSSVGSLTISSFTVNNNPNRLMIVGVNIADKTKTIQSVTYGGVNLTKLTGVDCTSTCHTELWYLTNPVVGTANVVVTLTSGATEIDAGVSVYYNVDPATPIAISTTGTGSANPSSVTLSGTTTQELVVDVFGDDNRILGVSGSATLRFTTDTSGGSPVSSSSLAGAAGSTTMKWSDASANWATIVVALNPPASTSADTLQDRLHVAASGNIGINTANPQHTLEVVGTANITGALTLGTASSASGTLVLNNSSNANTITLQSGATSASYTLTLPTAVGAATQCLQAVDNVGTLGWGGCGGSGGGGVSLQATTPGTPDVGNFNVSGTGIAATFEASTFDTASGVALAIGTGSATAINIGKTTSNIMTTINGIVLAKPTSGNDSTTAFQIQNAAGRNLLTVDTVNSKVGIGISIPTNGLSVSPLDYQAGTVTRTNSSATLVGTGTTWTSSMVGDIIIFADGTTNTVSAFTDTTHITMGTTYTGTTDVSPVTYRFHKVGLQVTSGGNVGVGVTSPSYSLVVNGQSQLGTASGAAGTKANQNILLYDFSANNWAGLQSNSSGDVNFSVGTSTRYTPLTLQAGTGYVGIGTTNPGNTLQVNGSFSAQGGDFQLADAGAIDSTAVRLLSSGGNLYLQGGSGGNIYFRSKTASTNVTIQDGGAVGIGTTTPGYKLEVNGDIRADGWLRTSGSTGWYSDSYGGGWNMQDTTWIRSYGSKATYLSGNGSVALSTASGNVGINTTNPTRALSVYGNISGGRIAAIVNATGTASTSTSILELKGGWADQSSGSRYLQFYSQATNDTNGLGEGSVDAIFGGVSYNTSTADFGEYFTLLNPMGYGDIAVSSTDNNGAYGVTKGTPQNANIVGVLSNTAGFVGNTKYDSTGGKDTTDRDVVGLMGQIKTHVSDINGPIHVGDPITVSSIPGFGAKAVSAGQIVGRAMQEFDQTAGSAATTCPTGTTNGVNCGTIVVLVSPSWYDPSTAMSSNLQGDNFASLNISGDLNTYRLTVTSDATFKANIIVEGHIVTGGTSPTAVAQTAAGADLLGRAEGACAVNGNDTSGLITITTGTDNLSDGLVCTITFSQPFSQVPHPVLMPVNGASVDVGSYVDATTRSMAIHFRYAPHSATAYQFNFVNLQ